MSSSRRFRCAACRAQPPAGGTVAVVGMVVLRVRRRHDEPSIPGDSAWHEVAVVSTPRYPARLCPTCAEGFARSREAPASV